MPKREISIILKARNAMAAGLASAWKSVKSFGSGVLSVGKWFAVGFGAAAASVAAFAVKALSAYAQQQKALVSLKGALAAYGDNAGSAVPKLTALATAISDQTGADDDALIAGMSRLRMLGVTVDQMEYATKATIALKSVGMEEAAAQKAVAMALGGNYNALARYVPAIRNATTEQEKAAAFADLVSKGYAQQAALLNTTSGAWAWFKVQIGNALENIGEAIEKSAGLQSILRTAGDAVKGFGEKVRQWIDSSQFREIQAAVQGIAKAIASGGGQRSEALKTLGEVIRLAFLVAVQNAVEFLRRAAPEIGDLIGSAARAAIDTMNPLRRKESERKKSEEDYNLLLSDAIKKGSVSQVLENGGAKSLFGVKDDSGEVILDAEISKWNDRQKKAARDAANRIREEKGYNELPRTGLNNALDDAIARLKAFGDSEKKIPGDNVPNKKTEAETPYDPSAVFSTANSAIEEAIKDQTDAVKNAEDAKEKASKMFYDKDFRDQEKQRVKQEAKDAKRLARALEQGAKGRKSAEITRAQELVAKDAQIAAERQRLADLEKARDIVQQQIRDNTEKIASNTAGIGEEFTPAED